uniref:Uncharacterized protein n=1 Tax=Anopheles braziliensis TaxID=58242 RepID=A0A2M3ZLU5_9DIPT
MMLAICFRALSNSPITLAALYNSNCLTRTKTQTLLANASFFIFSFVHLQSRIFLLPFSLRTQDFQSIHLR